MHTKFHKQSHDFKEKTGHGAFETVISLNLFQEKENERKIARNL